MKIKRESTSKAAPARDGSRRGRPVAVRDEPSRRRGAAAPQERRRSQEAPVRDKRDKRDKRDAQAKNARVSGPAREQRPVRTGPVTTPVQRPSRPTSTSQAKARAKARKAKAPKLVRVPLRERILIRLTRLAELDLSPRRLIARVPFVVLVIAALGIGLGVTLWLSTDAAERSYQLGHAHQVNEALLQQKESLERQVLEQQAAPALAEAARNLGMIPSRDTAHLVQDPSGNWVVVGTPKPAQGVQPPPLNVKLPDPTPPAATMPRPAAPIPLRAPDAERPVVVSGVPAPAVPGLVPGLTPGLSLPPVAAAAPEVLVRTPEPGTVPTDQTPLPVGAVPGALPLAGPSAGTLAADPAIPATPAIPDIPVIPVIPAAPAPMPGAPA